MTTIFLNREIHGDFKRAILADKDGKVIDFIAKHRSKKNERTIDELIDQQETLKLHIKRLQNQLDDVNQKIIGHVELKAEGSTTLKTGTHKVTTTQSIRREVNKEKAQDVVKLLPPEIGNLIFDYKVTLNTKLFKQIQDQQPENYNIICEAVTSKPSKPSVKIEEIKQ